MSTYKEKQMLELFHDGESLRSIATRLQCARKTIKKVLDAAVEKNLSYEQISMMSEKEFHDYLFPAKKKELKCEMPDFEYVHKEMAKVGVTVKLLWEEYADSCEKRGVPHYQYSYFRELYKNFTDKKHYKARLTFKPAQRVFLDWNGKRMSYYNPITGVEKKVYLFVGTLPFSGYTYVEATDTMKEEDWINCHIHMFEYFGGCVDLFVCDNLKTGVISHKKGEEIILNKSYKELADYYGACILPTRVRAPQDKGAVENAVQKTTQQIVARYRNEIFTSLAEVNKAIRQGLDAFNKKPFQQKEGSRYSIFMEQEKEFLKPLPTYKYEYATWKMASVQPNSHVAVDFMYYSCPNVYIKEHVDVRISKAQLDIYFHGKHIASHKRLYGSKGQYSTDKNHLSEGHRAYLDWNKDRFLRWANSIGEATHQVISKLFSNAKYEEVAYRGCFSILGLAKIYGKERLEKACSKALLLVETPRYRDLKTILKSKLENLEDKEFVSTRFESDKFALVRGAAYYKDEYDSLDDETNKSKKDEQDGDVEYVEQ